MAYKTVKTVQITNRETVALINAKAAEENRTAATTATNIILEALGNNNRKTEPVGQVENGI